MGDLSPPLSAAALGTLDFSLLYDQENNALHCTISKAKVGPATARGRPGGGAEAGGGQPAAVSCPGPGAAVPRRQQGTEGVPTSSIPAARKGPTQGCLWRE